MLLIARFESLVVVMSDKESSDGSRSGERMENAGGKPERRGSDGEAGAGEQELATKMLQIQSKRFYLDVKQNKRGKFIKVAEISADGRRSQIFLALSTAAEFRDQLSAFSDFYSSLGPPSQDTQPEDGKLKSEMMIKDNRLVTLRYCCWLWLWSICHLT